MNDVAHPSGASPLVCPFVALAEDRNRRADGPDQSNRCYAEPAPRQRDLAYQSDFCYSQDFSTCSVFLAWAARNAAEPAYVTEAAQRAWGAGIAAPEDIGDADHLNKGTFEERAEAASGDLNPDDGLFGPPDADEAADGSTETAQQLGWVSAAAWAEAPWDDQAEAEAEELERLEAEQADEDEYEGLDDEDDAEAATEEATTAPKVPAALPMRRRRTRQRPIRTRGSGEWFYADPLDHEPLVRRRYAVTPPILLGVVGLLVVALILFLVPTLLSGGDPDTAALPSASPDASSGPSATRAPVVAATPSISAEPSPTPTPRIRSYRVKTGDTLSSIAARFNVRAAHIQCMNRILNKNIVVLGARYQIPPKGYTCPPGWRRATPEPE